MSKNYQTGIIITGDGKGGIKAIEATDGALKRFNKSANKSKGTLQSMSDAAAVAAKRVAGVSAAVTGAAAAGAAFVAYNARQIQQQQNLADAINVSTASLSSMNYAFKDAQIGHEKLGDILKDTSEKIGDYITTGGGEAADVMERLNLSAEELAGLTADQQLLKIAASLEQVNSQSEKIFLLESLASDASLLLPVLGQGAEGLNKAMLEAKALGVALNDVDSRKISAAASDMGRLTSVFGGAANLITSEFAPAFGALSGMIVDSIVQTDGLRSATGDLGSAFTDVLGVMFDGYDAVKHSMAGIETKQAAFVKNMADRRVAMVKLNPFASEDDLRAALQAQLNAAKAYSAAIGKEINEQERDRGAELKAELQSRLKAYQDEANERLKLIKKTGEASSDEVKALADFSDMLSFIAETEREWNLDVVKERAAIQADINELTLSEAEKRKLILQGLEPENRALQKKLFILQDQQKAQEALNKINQAYADDMDQLRFDMVKYKLTAADVAAAEAMRAAANKGYSRDQINAIGAETKALFALQEANKASLKEEKAVADERNIIYENMFNRLDDGFAQMWVDVMDGSKTAFDFIQESFKRAIAEMAHAAITKPIILSVMGGSQGSAGLANLAGSSADLFGIASSLNGTSQSAMLAAQTAEFGSAGTALTAEAAGGAAGGFGAMASAAMPWIAGGLAVEALTGGAISKGLFGGDWKRKNAEISLSGGMSGVDAYQSITQQKAGGLFSSRKKKTSTEDISSSLGSTVSGLLQEIDTIANQIGFDLADNFSTEVKVSAGKKGSIQEAMAEAVGTVTNEAIDSVSGLRAHLTQFQRAGESLTDTMKRLAEETKAETAAAKAASEEKIRMVQAEKQAMQQALTDSEKALVQQFIGFESQTKSLKETLLGLSDQEALLAYQREQQLASIDPLLQAQQKRVWALEDEAKAIDKAKAAQSSYQSALSGVLGNLGGAFKTIKQFTAALALGASATGASYASTLSLAQGGDQNALSSITQSAQSYLDDARARSATALDYERIKSSVITDLNKLPEQVSAQQFIADEIKAAIASQTDTLSLNYGASLKDNFDALIPVVGETITKDEFDSIYAGTASDAELKKVFEALAGADGVIDSVDLTTAAAAETALKTDVVGEKAKSQLTELESIAESTKGQIAAMGVLTEALGYASNVQQQAVLQAAVDTAQQRFDGLSITEAQVKDYEDKKAAADATDAKSLYQAHEAVRLPFMTKADNLRNLVNKGVISQSEYKYMYNLAEQDYTGSAGYKDYWSAVEADNAYAGVANLANDVQRYNEVAAQLKAAKDALNAMPAFAAGGIHTGGIRLVGERGPELEVTGPSRIINNTNTNKLLDNSELIAELKALRSEIQNLANGNNSANLRLINLLQDIDDRFDDWTIDGLPNFRATQSVEVIA